MVTSSDWSPFFIGFAIGQNFVAPVYAWMAIGTVSALLFTIVTLLGLNREFARGQLSLSLSCFRPVASRLLIVLLTVLGVALVFGLTVLSAVVVVMPLLVAEQLVRHRDKARIILLQSRDAMHSTADDLAVITVVMLVAFFATQDDSLTSLVGRFHAGQIPGWAALISTPVLLMLFSVAGIHPVITSAALLATFSGGGADVRSSGIAGAGASHRVGRRHDELVCLAFGADMRRAVPGVIPPACLRAQYRKQLWLCGDWWRASGDRQPGDGVCLGAAHSLRALQ